MFDVRICLLLLLLMVVVVVVVAAASPARTIANNFAEKFLVDTKLFEMDLLDKCEDIAHLKHQYYRSLNNRTQSKHFERKFGQFQNANIEMGRLIATSASEIREYYEYLGAANKSHENRLVKTLVNVRELNEPVLSHREIKLRQFLERKYYDFRTRGELERILANGHLSATDLKSALNKYDRDFRHELADLESDDSLEAVVSGDSDASSMRFELNFLSFEQLNDTWNEIAFLYEDLLEFVKERISQKYRFSDQPVPSYLLGTILGDDWTNLFEFVLPYPDYVNRNLFAAIENSRTIDNLWTEIALNSRPDIGLIDNYDTCPVDLLHYCRTATTKLTVCKRLRVSDYFDLFAKYIENHLLSSDRGYGLTAAIANAAGARTEIPIFSEIVSLASCFNALDVLFDSTDRGGGSGSALEASMMRKLLLALRILPKLAYYQFVEKWRTDIRARNATGEAAANETIASLWSRMRLHEQNIDDCRSTFLFDPNIFLNKPYAGKFFATIMQFQLLEEAESETGDPDTAEFRFPSDIFPRLIRKVLENNGSDDGHENYSIRELSVSKIVRYFQPLFAYLRNASGSFPEFYELEEPAATTIESSMETSGGETTEAGLVNGTVSVLASVIANSSGGDGARPPQPQPPPPPTNAIDSLLEFKVAVCAFLVTFVACFVLIFLLIFLRRLCCRCRKKTKFAKNRRFS